MDRAATCGHAGEHRGPMTAALIAWTEIKMKGAMSW